MADQQQPWADYQAAAPASASAATPGGPWSDYGAPAADSQPPSANEFVKNAVTGGVQFAKNAVAPLFHPLDTAKALLNLGMGVVAHSNSHTQEEFPEATATVNAFMDHLKERYGSLDAVKRAAYTDPVGFAADASMLASGGGAVAKIGSELAEAGGLTDAASALSKTSGALGKAAEVANPATLPAKAAEALTDAAGQPIARSLYQSALKPGVAEAPTLDNMRQVVQTGLDNSIPVSAKGATKLSGLVDDYKSKIQALVDAGTARGQTVDPAAVAARVDQLQPKIQAQVNPVKDLSAIANSKQEFLKQNNGPIPLNIAQAIKTGTYTQLPGKYGEMGAATVEAQKALARGLKEELETQIPILKDLNDQEGKALDLQGALERAVRRNGNNDLMNSGDAIAAGAGAIAGGPAGAAAGFVKKIADSPGVKSRVALALVRASSNSGAPIGQAAALARVGTAFDSIIKPAPNNSPGPAAQPPGPPAQQQPVSSQLPALAAVAQGARARAQAVVDRFMPAGQQPIGNGPAGNSQ